MTREIAYHRRSAIAAINGGRRIHSGLRFRALMQVSKDAVGALRAMVTRIAYNDTGARRDWCRSACWPGRLGCVWRPLLAVAAAPH